MQEVVINHVNEGIHYLDLFQYVLNYGDIFQIKCNIKIIKPEFVNSLETTKFKFISFVFIHAFY